jgi:hypothetical protein
MPEGNETGTLPGGFESVDKLYAEFVKVKDEAIANKTKAAERKALEDELAALKADADKRKQSEMTELEKAQARIAALEGNLSEREQAILKVQKEMLLERVLSKRLGAVPDTHRELVRLAYERAASADFADETELETLLTPVDEHVKTIAAPAQAGVRSVSNPVNSPGGKPSPQATAAAKEWQGMSFTEKMQRAREAKKR